MYFGVFRRPLSEKKRNRSPIPQLPFVSVFPETSQGNSAKRHRLRGPSPITPLSSARAWPPAAAVARARRTVRDVRARAAFACAGDWGTVRSPNGHGPSPPPTGPSSSRASAFGQPRVPGGRGGWEGTGTGLSARLRSPTACFFFSPSGLAGGGLLDEKRIWGPAWFCPFLNPQSSCGSGSRTGGRLNKALGSLRVTLLCHPHSPVPCLRGFQWIG